MNDEIIIFPWLEDNYPQKIKQIVQETQSKDIIIFNPEEHSVFYDLKRYVPNLLKYLSQNKSRVIIWQGNHYESIEQLSKSPLIKVYNWPTFLVHYTYTFGKHYPQYNYQDADRFMISMNNTAHPFRCQFIDCLAENNLVDNNYISWRNKTNVIYNFNFFDGYKRVFDKEDRVFDQFVLPDEYYKSFISVVSESCVDRLDISEKIYIPLYTKKPFIAIGARHYYNKLSELGFELYNEIFDYKFDKYKKYEDRLKNIVLQLKDLENQSYVSMYNKIKDKLEYNRQHFLKLKNNPSLIPPRFKSLYYKYSKHDYFKQTYIANIL